MKEKESFENWTGKENETSIFLISTKCTDIERMNKNGMILNHSDHQMTNHFSNLDNN